MAFEEGRQARRGGVARNANPYPSGPSRASWDEGWDTTDTILRSLGLS
jgi:ribosome modulation factor